MRVNLEPSCLKRSSHLITAIGEACATPSHILLLGMDISCAAECDASVSNSGHPVRLCGWTGVARANSTLQKLWIRPERIDGFVLGR